METPSNGGYSPGVAFTSLGNVEAVAVDGSGNVYISSLAYGLVKETLTAGTYTQSTMLPNVNAFGIALDGQGNIYLGDSVNNQVLKEALSGGSYTQSTVDSGLNGPHGVAVDRVGNVYVANTFGSGIVKETLSGGVYTQSTVASGLNDPLGVAVDGSGNVFLCSGAASSVWKVNYADPPSLSFAATNVGSTSSSQTVAVKNIGNAALSFPVPGAGNNPSIATNFILDSSGGSACPLVSTNSSSAGTLVAGNSCLLSISFAPATSSSVIGWLVLTDTNLNAAAPNYAAQIIVLSGRWRRSGSDLDNRYGGS